MPAQSGSSKVLAKMRRGYTREVYDQLISRVREKIPDITISSDFISGFCSETEEDHLDTLSLLESVQYEQAFMFAYSMREKTHAQYKLTDDVSEPEKLRRLQEVIATFRKHMVAKNQAEQDSLHLVLVEGPGRKSSSENPTWTGRTDGNKRCIFSADVQLSEFKTEDDVLELLARGGLPPPKSAGSSAVSKGIMTGDYVVVRVEECKGQTLYCRGVGVCSLTNFHKASERLLDREKWLDVDQGVF
jgi:tRNA A37 methylthiotransferase MiaB